MDGSRRARSPLDTAEDPVDVLRDALATAVARLAGLDGQAPGAVYAARRIGVALTESLPPVRGMLARLVVAESAGPVAMALNCSRNAVSHLDQGELAAGRAAVVTAHVTLARLDRTTNSGALPDWRS